MEILRPKRSNKTYIFARRTYIHCNAQGNLCRSNVQKLHETLDCRAVSTQLTVAIEQIES